MFNGSNCDRKSQLSGILTEPLNPRDTYPDVYQISKTTFCKQNALKKMQLIYIFHRSDAQALKCILTPQFHCSLNSILYLQISNSACGF